MPYQIKNGVVYGSNAVSLTQAQYDALSTAEKNNGTVYYIYDSDAVMNAGDVGIDGGGNLQNLVGSVATIETSPATATHAVGDYIVYNGQLYEVTAAIAVGETLTVGTNIESTTAGAELTSLNTGLTQLDSRSFTRSTYRQWDANNLTEQGVYHVALTSHGPTSSTSYGVMLVIKIGTYGAQFFVTGTTTFARYRNDGSWLNWQALN